MITGLTCIYTIQRDTRTNSIPTMTGRSDDPMQSVTRNRGCAHVVSNFFLVARIVLVDEHGPSFSQSYSRQHRRDWSILQRPLSRQSRIGGTRPVSNVARTINMSSGIDEHWLSSSQEGYQDIFEASKYKSCRSLQSYVRIETTSAPNRRHPRRSGKSKARRQP